MPPSPPPSRSWRWCGPAPRTAARTPSNVGFPLEMRGEHARVPPALAEEPRQLLRVAMGDEHAPGPRLLDRAEERRPVGVVGEDEAAVVSLAPARAAYPHPARGECYLPLPEPPHPRRPSRRERGEHQLARVRSARGQLGHAPRGEHRDPLPPVPLAHLRDRAVDEDRTVGE